MSLHVNTRIIVLSLFGLLAAVTDVPAQSEPAPKRPATTRVRVNDQARMKALVREGEKLLKSGATTPYAKLQEGLQRTGCTVALAKPSTKDLSGPELFKRSRQSVVVISSLYYCTRCTKLHATTAGGVVVGTSGEVLTNEHVIRGRADRKSETIVAMTADGTVIPVREVLASSKKDDVAVIRLDMSNARSLPPLPLGTNPPPGSDIRVMSHPNKHFYHLSSGIISRYFSENGPGGETEVMSITADYGRGSSGCPVLDRKGNIVGLVSRTSSLYYRQTKEKQENLQMVFKLCVAASSIRTLTEKSEPSVVTALPAIKLTGLPKTRGSVEEPLFLNSNDDLDKLIQDKKLSKTYSKHVDWEKQVVLVFRWSGSGQDQLETRTKGEEPVTVQFVYRRGRTRDLRPHLKLFVIERGVQWIVESRPATRPQPPKPVGTATEASAFKAVEKVLQVRRRGTLVFARPTTAGVDQLEKFLKTYPKSAHRQEALYLRGLSLWMLKRYDQAAAAYRVLLDAFPKGKHTRMARIREAGALLFSDQPQPALDRLNELMTDYPDRPEMYGRERAHALVLVGRQKEAREFMDHVESQMLAAGKDRLVPRMRMQFAPLRMVGRPLKAFQVARHGADGQIDSSSLKGQVVLVDFWATWCRPCVAELPHLRAAHEKFADQGFQIVSISLDEKQELLDAFISREKMNWLHHFDGKKWKNELAVLFDVHSIPMNLLVDRQGIVRAANLRGTAVARRVEELLKPPAAAPKK